MATLLNETCVSFLTSNYTNITQYGSSITARCSYTVPTPPPSVDLVHVCILVLMFMFLGIIVSSTIYCTQISNRTRNLHLTPSYQLHKQIEEDYQKYWGRSKKARQDWNAAGYANRYMSISYIDDALSNKRTVTIVEDLNLIPAGARGTMSCGRVRSVHQIAGAAGSGYGTPLAIYRELGTARANGEVVPPPGQFVSPRVGSSSVAPPPPAVVRDEEERIGNEYANAAPPPPAYKKYQWQSIV
ncbi:hypothetical protein BKA61DRAFT_670094 [Leptodontidium sp. MPI-SDFR-AT-0119]|nr:hypothetical protein BKA61DRAFT_670094 [Leptodontidium sp. MPI-SDFR-AT-0119]